MVLTLTDEPVGWCPRVREVADGLTGVQRLACLAAIGGICSTPGAAWVCCLHIPPPDIFVRSAAKPLGYSKNYLDPGGWWARHIL